MITFGQLFLAVSLPTLVALLGVILNQLSYKDLATELKNFRIEMAKELGAIRTEMAKELGAIDTRISIIETKIHIVPPAKPEPAKEVAA